MFLFLSIIIFILDTNSPSQKVLPDSMNSLNANMCYLFYLALPSVCVYLNTCFSSKLYAS